MATDFQSKGGALKRVLLADVETMVIRLLSGLSASVAAQKDGTVVSDQHRILNFNGGGVTVTDDPSGRRTNINIPGGSASTVNSTFNSSTASKALSLWNGSSNNSPPANWETTGFSDAAWSAPAQIAAGPPASLWPTSSPLNAAEQALVRQSFTLPGSISIQSATLNVGCDDYLLGAWVNGTFLSGSIQTAGALRGAMTLSVPIGLLTPGAAVLVAVHGANFVGTSSGQAGIYFQLSLISSIQGSATNLLLDYTLSSSVTTAVVTTGWTDLAGTSQTFTTDNPYAVVEVLVGGNYRSGSVANDVAVQLVVDGTAKFLSGNWHNVSQFCNVLAGAPTIPILGLANGSHTVKLQGRVGTGNETWSCDGTSAIQGFSLRVLQVN